MFQRFWVFKRKQIFPVVLWAAFLAFSLVSVGQAFWNKEKSVKIFPLRVGGDWGNPANLSGKAEVGEKGDQKAFNSLNSAIYEKGSVVLGAEEFSLTEDEVAPATEDEELIKKINQFQKGMSLESSILEVDLSDQTGEKIEPEDFLQEEIDQTTPAQENPLPETFLWPKDWRAFFGGLVKAAEKLLFEDLVEQEFVRAELKLSLAVIEKKDFEAGFQRQGFFWGKS